MLSSLSKRGLLSLPRAASRTFSSSSPSFASSSSSSASSASRSAWKSYRPLAIAAASTISAGSLYYLHNNNPTFFPTLFSSFSSSLSSLLPPSNVVEAGSPSDDDNLPTSALPVVDHPIVFAPNVPPPITRKHRALIKVDMNTSVVKSKIHGEYLYEFWTFNGQVPGPFIRARVGDVLQVNMTNDDQSGMMHNVDFHAVTGPGGGAELLTAETGETKTASFKLLVPGLYYFHCAVGPVPVHVANGMYGMILVEPKEGLPKVDKEFYVMQSEFYYETRERPKANGKKGHGHPMANKGAVKTPEELAEEEEYYNTVDFSYEAGLSENPKAIVFNGRDGALKGEGTLQVNQGERVRIFFGNAGPNLISSFHVIGAIFDKVYREGDLISPPARGLQSTLVPSGGATVVEFDTSVPGTFTLVDHSLFRLEKGAVGFLKVNGKPRPDIFHSEAPRKVCPDCGIHP